MIDTRALNGIKMPLGRVSVRVAHVFIDQCEQQFFLCCIEIACRQALKSAQAVAPTHASEHVGEKGLGGYDRDPSLLRMQRVHHIKTANGFVTEDHETGIRPGQILQGLGAEEQGRRSDPAVRTGETCAEMMTCEQPGPGLAADRLAEFQKAGFGHFPVCIAKTQYSFTTDPNAKGAPNDHVLGVREVRLSAGAEFIVAICGEIMTMPGLPRVPAANNIELTEDGRITGLF